MGEQADELARRCADAMWSEDRASQGLGMVIDHVGAGSAQLSMTVRDDMVNGHGICHGGIIFALADSAFAFACNSFNQNTVAQHCTISFLAPARQGDRLEARASKRTQAGRSGIYDVTVRDQAGTIVAEFRGFSRTIAGTLVPEGEIAEERQTNS
ncbi:MAG: hydroxyphenylacetyl-CoA thioesterase PaaI [Geminicoccaceae bacterium]